jgi:molybdopterin/thiamine biosynthesis adenylyltransferase
MFLRNSSHRAVFRVVRARAHRGRDDFARAPRKARLPQFLSLAVDADQTLAGLRIAVVGVGSVGRPAALHLARLQPRILWLIDRGKFKAESLLTQPILPDEVGQPKASCTGRLCKEISPQTAVYTCDGAIEDLDPFVLTAADLVILATDNLAAEIETSTRCFHLGIPLVQASVHGATLTAQVRFLANRDSDGPCLACEFGAQEWNHLNQQTRFSCEGWQRGILAGKTEGPSEGTSEGPVGPVTASVSFLCSLAADLALLQATRFFLGLGQQNTDTLVEYNGYTHRMVTTSLRHNRDCRCEHATWLEAAAPGSLQDCSIEELVTAAGLEGDGPGKSVAVTVEDRQWVRRADCACGRHLAVAQWLAPGEPAGSCPACRCNLGPNPFFSHRRTPLTVLGREARTPLGNLTNSPVRWVIVHSGARGIFFRDRSRVSGVPGGSGTSGSPGTSGAPRASRTPRASVEVSS